MWPCPQPHPGSEKERGTRGPPGGSVGPHLPPLPARSPSPKASHTYPGSYPVVQRESQALQPRTGPLTSEESQLLHSSHSRPFGRIWLPVSSKPELEQVSVCLGNSRKGTVSRPIPVASPQPHLLRRLHAESPLPLGPIQQGWGFSFIMEKAQRAPWSRQHVQPRG